MTIRNIIFGIIFMFRCETVEADYYGGTGNEVKAITGNVSEIRITPEDDIFEYSFVVLKDYSTGTWGTSPEIITSSTAGDGYLIFKKDDNQILAVLLSALNSGNQVTIKLSGTEWLFGDTAEYNRIEYVVISNN